MSARRKQNIGNAEQFARVAIGAALALLGIAVLAGGPALWGLVGAVLAVIVGLGLVITGASGHCPPCARLGYVSKALTGAARVSAPAHHHDLPARPAEDSDSAYEGHSGWLMLLCCALMVVAVVLIALGR